MGAGGEDCLENLTLYFQKPTSAIFAKRSCAAQRLNEHTINGFDAIIDYLFKFIVNVFLITPGSPFFGKN